MFPVGLFLAGLRPRLDQADLSVPMLQLPRFPAPAASLDTTRQLRPHLQALGTEVRTFTSGHISATTAVLVAAAILLVFDLLGGMRSVAYTDVLQGFILLVGSIIFLVIQRTSLGGLPAAALFYRWA